MDEIVIISKDEYYHSGRVSILSTISLMRRIIEAILDGNPPSVGMTELLDPMTHVWTEQRSVLGYEGR